MPIVVAGLFDHPPGSAGQAKEKWIEQNQLRALSTSLFFSISRPATPGKERKVDRTKSVAGLIDQLVLFDHPPGNAGQAKEKWIEQNQLRALSTSLFFSIHGIMARSLPPTSSI
ncbi:MULTISPECIES: hypothetical protein [unclassified Brucella]|uniref:hypothetical protein n=1 Tax=unclassified Brucella TaxID=2632610 RepID=UPI0015B71800|nr:MULTISPECIES: hypothetical protein [unclassified Brucella]